MIENLRNKFVENPESLRDYYNDLDKLIESKDLNVFITYDKSFVDEQIEKLIEKQKTTKIWEKCSALQLVLRTTSM